MSWSLVPSPAIPVLWAGGSQLEGEVWGRGTQLCQAPPLLPRPTEVSSAPGTQRGHKSREGCPGQWEQTSHRHPGTRGECLEESAFGPQATQPVGGHSGPNLQAGPDRIPPSQNCQGSLHYRRFQMSLSLPQQWGQWPWVLSMSPRATLPST